MASANLHSPLADLGIIPETLQTVIPEILRELKHLDLTGQVAFHEGKVIGCGAYGDISSAACNLASRGTIKVAVKRLRFYMQEDVKLLFEKEIYVWSKLSHPNVLPLLGYAFDQLTGCPLLVSEWMQKGSAWTCVNSKPDCNLLQLITGVAKGLAYLHERGVVHSDVKSDNIVVSESEDALICDFGCSRMIDASRSLANLSTGIKGTVRYTAYEVLVHSTQYSRESDVWAFGMTVYELWARKRPYNQLKELQVMQAISRHKLPTFLRMRRLLTMTTLIV
ncbi:kinase-like protein [Fomitiporia mediterranea MF3/22]|uniref:kinase-like protein n=1 Tax=Fomitiporia mediterranea (strain MF3/22) TaxID=694068 RepID=UPI0004408D8C|nr:kinase-like protein [Fomitiporia mediterranea MF3/22]EJD00914.1 kinase-like protein [Fomitiporia mediterranea MF3/22]